MKKNLLFFLIFTISFSAFADGSFHLGASYIYQTMHYKEPAIMDEKGKITGYSIEMRYALSERLRLGAELRFLGGHLEYNGSTFSGTPIKQTTNDIVREYRSTLGYALGSLRPFIGIGQRYWSNDLVISYLRETTYNYMPLGLTYTSQPFYITYEHRQFLSGTNKSHMSDVGGGRKDVSFTQKTGQGYLCEVGFFFPVSVFDMKVSLGYEHWQIDNSTISNDGVDDLIEPHNSTNSFIASVGLFY
jgi:hypothetical protein